MHPFKVVFDAIRQLMLRPIRPSPIGGSVFNDRPRRIPSSQRERLQLEITVLISRTFAESPSWKPRSKRTWRVSVSSLKTSQNESPGGRLV